MINKEYNTQRNKEFRPVCGMMKKFQAIIGIVGKE